ncbi:MAG: wax ester/triacylglycerol synthase family O-acyltransferase [Acidimicrobiia bacterium]|nr:wax ester/triacylglycerol synthase family O-acyltransferase [Acidimicrobiia bacterium]
MDRLSALDAEFLHLEDGIAHMHIAGMCVFDGPAPGHDDVVALLEARLDRIPRYRQRVRSVPLELGRPVWVDDPHFSLEYHVRATALAPPADDAVLCRLMGRLMSQPLDRDRPLWETWVVYGLPDDQWALVCKVHHCMVDGVAGVDLLTALLSLDPDEALPEPTPWSPSPEPSGAAKVVDAWAGLGGDVAEVLGRLPAVATRPAGLVRSLRDTGVGIVRFGEHLVPTPPSSIEGPIGPHRVWAHTEVPLEQVKVVRRALGGTVNDVVLAAVANGYRSLLLHRGEDPDGAVVRTLVPVSVRTGDAHGVTDNRVSGMLYELPVHLADPRERLDTVMAEMGALKGSHMPEAGEVVTTVGDLAPPMLLGAVSRMAIRTLRTMSQQSVNTVTTNVPGPQFPLYCLGREMREYRPFVPLSHGVRVGTAILSYNGTLSFGVTGDLDTASDVDVLAGGIVAGVDELVAAAHREDIS